MIQKRLPLSIFIVLSICVLVIVLAVFSTHHKNDVSSSDGQPQMAVPLTELSQPGAPSSTLRKPEATGGPVVSGRVRNRAGEPVPNAQVEILPLRVDKGVQTRMPDFALGTVATATSQKDGAFRIADSLQTGTYCFWISADGYAQLEEFETIPEEGVENLEFILDSGALVSGRVIDLDGTPVPNAIAFVMTSQGEFREGRTSRNGAFRLPLVKAGTLQFYVRFAPMPVWGTTSANMSGRPLFTLDVEPGKEYRGVEVVVKWRAKSRSIDGVVVNTDNRPIQGARVWATRASNPLLHKCGEAERLTSSKGEFRIAQVSADPEAVVPDYALDEMFQIETVFLHCEHPDCEPAHVEKVLVGTSGVTVVVEPRDRGTITGRVLVRATRQPVTDAQVGPWSSLKEDGSVFYNKDDFINLVRSGVGQVDQNGEFSCENVRSGEVTLIAYSPTWGTAIEHNVMVRKDGITKTDIFFDTPGRLEVRFTTEITSPRSAMRSVRVSPESTDPATFPPFSSEAQYFLAEDSDPSLFGGYITSLAPGKYRVQARVWRPYELRGPGTYVWQQTVEIRAGETTSIEPTSPATGTMRLQLPIDESSENAEILVVPDGDPSFLASLDVPIVTTDHGPLFDQYPYVLCLMYGAPEIVADYIPAGRVTILININRRMTDEWRQLGVKVVDIIPDQENLVVFEGNTVSGEHADS